MMVLVTRHWWRGALIAIASFIAVGLAIGPSVHQAQAATSFEALEIFGRQVEDLRLDLAAVATPQDLSERVTVPTANVIASLQAAKGRTVAESGTPAEVRVAQKLNALLGSEHYATVVDHLLPKLDLPATMTIMGCGFICEASGWVSDRVSDAVDWIGDNIGTALEIAGVVVAGATGALLCGLANVACIVALGIGSGLAVAGLIINAGGNTADYAIRQFNSVPDLIFALAAKCNPYVDNTFIHVSADCGP